MLVIITVYISTPGGQAQIHYTDIITMDDYSRRSYVTMKVISVISHISESNISISL